MVVKRKNAIRKLLFICFFYDDFSCKVYRLPLKGFQQEGDGPRTVRETTDFMTNTTKATTTEKTYTEAQEAILTQAAIDAGGKIDGALAETLASQLGKDVRSVRAKAARMGIYKAAEKKSKSGLPIETKEEIALAIAAIVGTNLDGLEKASKRTLQILRERLQA